MPEWRASSTSRCSATPSNAKAASARPALIYEWLKRPDGRQPYFSSGGRRNLELRRLVGQVEESRDRRARNVVHDHRHGCERTDPADSRPDAGGTRPGGHRAWLNGEAGTELRRVPPASGRESA